MKVISIAAVSEEGIIGREGKLPWHIPEDLKFFRESTRGQTVVMGRKTFESLGKPLPARRNVVCTRSAEFKKNLAAKFPDVVIYDSIETAIKTEKNRKALGSDHSENSENVFVIGGGEIYLQSIHLVDEVWLTHVRLNLGEQKGDVKFPFVKQGVFSEPSFQEASWVKGVGEPEIRFVKYQRKL